MNTRSKIIILSCIAALGLNLNACAVGVGDEDYDDFDNTEEFEDGSEFEDDENTGQVSQELMMGLTPGCKAAKGCRGNSVNTTCSILKCKLKGCGTNEGGECSDAREMKKRTCWAVSKKCGGTGRIISGFSRSLKSSSLNKH